MQMLCLVVLLGLAVQAPAARVKRTQNSEVAKTHVAQEEEVQATSAGTPTRFLGKKNTNSCPAQSVAVDTAAKCAAAAATLGGSFVNESSVANYPKNCFQSDGVISGPCPNCQPGRILPPGPRTSPLPDVPGLGDGLLFYFNTHPTGGNEVDSRPVCEAEADEHASSFAESEKEVELAEDAEEESAEDAEEFQEIERMYAEAEAEEIERIYSEDPWSNQHWQDEGWRQVNNQLSDGYWYEHKDELKKDFIAPKSFESQNFQRVPKENVMQVFEVQENFRLINNQYVAKLEEEQDAYTRRPLRKKIRARLMKITDYFWTMHGHQAAQFFDQHGHLAGEYTMFHPVYFAKHWTWRVVKKADPDQIIYTIQKRFWNDHCKFAGFLACRPVLKIYKGEVGDKSTLIYYGVGDKKLKEPDFKFYHARSEYKQNRHQFWVGKIDHKKSKKFGRDKYKVYVKPGEDTGLLLLATACLDAVGDSVKR